MLKNQSPFRYLFFVFHNSEEKPTSQCHYVIEDRQVSPQIVLFLISNTMIFWFHQTPLTPHTTAIETRKWKMLSIASINLIFRWTELVANTTPHTCGQMYLILVGFVGGNRLNPLVSSGLMKRWCNVLRQSTHTDFPHILTRHMNRTRKKICSHVYMCIMQYERIYIYI